MTKPSQTRHEVEIDCDGAINRVAKTIFVEEVPRPFGDPRTKARFSYRAFHEEGLRSTVCIMTFDGKCTEERYLYFIHDLPNSRTEQVSKEIDNLETKTWNEIVFRTDKIEAWVGGADRPNGPAGITIVGGVPVQFQRNRNEMMDISVSLPEDGPTIATLMELYKKHGQPVDLRGLLDKYKLWPHAEVWPLIDLAP